ncbi:hypothetical protein BU16DRAFT_532719 [Lophium mytilinum]|uniref:Uncharacterized protein n=1 Tax=Lophium mytilinum TaxID=390894 RepID=A0A6A6RD84_9PEZI|nr:hypothetical protein BU16DRAFT_532719 [Lophium mytilinum]
MASAIELQGMNDGLKRRHSTRASSTATALSTYTTASSTAARRRSTPAINQQYNSSEDEPPSYYNTQPQEALTASLPKDSPSFAPTHTFWVTPNGMFTRSIPVYDLTSDISTPYTGLSSVYKASVQTALKDHSQTPCYTLTRQSWYGQHYNITDATGASIADWQHPWSSGGAAVLTFPTDSTHSTHAVAVRDKRWYLHNQTFVLNSVTYEWRNDGMFVSQAMTLYKMLGSQRVTVGKYTSKWWWSWSGGGGTLVVDANEVDELVAVVSLAVVLKKKRQRAAERRVSGGGGGGC